MIAIGNSARITTCRFALVPRRMIYLQRASVWDFLPLPFHSFFRWINMIFRERFEKGWRRRFHLHLCDGRSFGLGCHETVRGQVDRGSFPQAFKLAAAVFSHISYSLWESEVRISPSRRGMRIHRHDEAGSESVAFMISLLFFFFFFFFWFA